MNSFEEANKLIGEKRNNLLEKHKSDIETLELNHAKKRKEMEDKRLLEEGINQQLLEDSWKEHNERLLTRTVELQQKHDSAVREHEEKIVELRKKAAEEKEMAKSEYLKKKEEQEKFFLEQQESDKKARNQKITDEAGFI
jgi:hypothetical protein